MELLEPPGLALAALPDDVGAWAGGWRTRGLAGAHSGAIGFILRPCIQNSGVHSLTQAACDHGPKARINARLNLLSKRLFAYIAKHSQEL
jgi:hypothetical protein